jgi:membrane-bound metal-dependent hydrolase YbcI (DUF457 family)
VKGIAHFVSGVALATFFPEIVYGASQSLGFGPVLGGLAGLLPDTLDFKLTRYFDRVDSVIDPAKVSTREGLPDPQAMAGQIAAAMDRAFTREEQVNVQLHTLRLAGGLWRSYSLTFDSDRREVRVCIGPLVTTGQIAVPGSEPSAQSVGWAQVEAPIAVTYDAEITVDIFSGPSIAFNRVGDAIEMTFLRWHRAWSHSLLTAFVVGGLGALIAPVLGLAMALATLLHAAADQLGYMGCNILFPVTRQRTNGLRLIRSGDAIPNFLVVWVSLAVILLNLDRFSTSPAIPVLPYLVGIIALPCVLLLGIAFWTKAREPRALPAALAAVEALDETEEVDI